MKSSGNNELEGEVFYPSQGVKDQAIVKDWDALAKSALQNLEGFWETEAGELEVYKKWETVLDDSKKPFYKWFSGGLVNIVHNCIDRHLKTFRKNKLALIWESEDGKLNRTFSYYAMNREVSRMANIIKAMGVVKGDRVTIYMGRVPEIVFSMLAWGKIGAIQPAGVGCGPSAWKLPGKQGETIATTASVPRPYRTASARPRSWMQKTRFSFFIP